MNIPRLKSVKNLIFTVPPIFLESITLVYGKIYTLSEEEKEKRKRETWFTPFFFFCIILKVLFAHVNIMHKLQKFIHYRAESWDFRKF